MSELTIRKIEIRDLDKIADVHKASFDDRALSQLGKTAIKRYYDWLLMGFPDNYPICATSEDDQIAGFCFAGDYSGSFTGFLKRHRCFLISRVLLRPWLIFNPLIRKQSNLALRTLLRLLRTKNKTRALSSHPKDQVKQARSFQSYGILAIAVNPNYQRQGVGQALMDAAETKAIADGYQHMHLSVHPDNFPAVRFYQKLGWQKKPPDENWSGKMTKNLN